MSLPIPGQSQSFKPVRKKENLTIKELQGFMQKHGLSVQELSEILGVTVQAVNLWLKGDRDISITTTRIIRLFIKYPQLLREFSPV